MLRFKHTLIVLFSLTVFFYNVAAAEESGEKGIAPNWMHKTLSGKEVSLYSDLNNGNHVVMIFWSTWCKFCRELLPKINTHFATIKEKPVRIYALNIWEDGDAQEYLKKNGITLEAVLHADSQAKQFNISGTPGVIAVSPNKKIIYRRKFGDNSEDVIAALSALY